MKLCNVIFLSSLLLTAVLVVVLINNLPKLLCIPMLLLTQLS